MINPAKLAIDKKLIRFEAAIRWASASVPRIYLEDPEKDFPRPFTIAGRQQWLRRTMSPPSSSEAAATSAGANSKRHSICLGLPISIWQSRSFASEMVWSRFRSRLEERSVQLWRIRYLERPHNGSSLPL